MSWWKRFFQSREYVFIKLLIDQARIGVHGVESLKKYMITGLKEYADAVTNAEKEEDEIRRILVDEINRSFVTPFDREDIYNLSRAIDDILDYANTTVEEMEILKVKPNEFLIKLSDLLLTAAKEVHLATQRIKDHPNVANEHARRIKGLENRIEDTYREAIAALFEHPKDINDVVYIFKLREIYRHLANAGDRADESANIISDIIVKST